MKHRLPAIIGCSIILLFPALQGFAQSNEAKRDELLNSIRAADKKLVNVSDSLKATSDKIFNLEAEISTISAEIEQTNLEITNINLELAELEQSIIRKIDLISKTSKTILIYETAIAQKAYLGRQFFNNYGTNSHLLKLIRKSANDEVLALKTEKLKQSKIKLELAKSLESLAAKNESIGRAKNELFIVQKDQLLLAKLIKSEKTDLISEAKIVEARLQSARPSDTAPKSELTLKTEPDFQNWIKPTTGKLIQEYGAKRVGDIKTYAEGVLLEVSTGTITAMAEGEVSSVDITSLGLYNVVITHGNGVIAIYGLLTDVLVKPQQKIAKGGAIGKISHHNVIGGSIFYLEVRHYYKSIDPVRSIASNDWK